MTTLIKNTNNDKRELLSKALRNHYSKEDKGYTYLTDFDDNYVYFDMESYHGHSYSTSSYKINYTIADVVNVSFSGEPQRVERLTEYKDLDTGEEVSKGFLESIIKGLDKHFGGSSKDTLSVIKQFNDESMIAVESLYITADTVDLHGDTISLEETHKLVKNFNEANEEGTLQTSLFHGHKSESFQVNKAWVNPYECMIGETVVPEGQPLCEIQFTNKKAWELRKSGTLMGLSIGATSDNIEEL